MNAQPTLLPARPPARKILLGWLGSALAIGLIASLGMDLQLPLVLGSFGASCVLVFGFPELPFSQPRNVLFGHVLSTAIGFATLTLLGPGPARPVTDGAGHRHGRSGDDGLALRTSAGGFQPGYRVSDTARLELPGLADSVGIATVAGGCVGVQ